MVEAWPPRGYNVVKSIVGIEDTVPPASADAASVLRFGAFELDAKNGELRREGAPVKLPPQPFKVLVLLATRPGQLVTREEIQHQVWSGETFVDFELGLNYCLNQIRTALGDHARTPRYIETAPRRGYRFIAPVEAVAPVYDRRPEDAAHRAALQRRIALAAGALVAIFAVLLGLNVASLRDRLVGARHGVPLPKIESIAVLPLENLSHDPEQEYFADGMTDALITDLGKVSALRVISRQSTMRCKGSKKPLPEIARELKVDAVVEGTVQRSGERVRITAQLLDARTDRHLWANAYERDLRDVLALQSDVAQAVAREVRVKLTPQEQSRLAHARPVNPEAHELYLRGSNLLEQGDRKRSLEYFQQAIDKDPNFARGYVGIAWAFNNLGDGEELASVEAYSKTKAFARQALELDDNLDSAHMWLGKALVAGDWDWLGGEREIKRALEINPNSAGAHSMYSGYLYIMDRREEAIAESRRALEISPNLAGPHYHLASAYFFGRRYDEAIAQCQEVLELNPKRCRDVLGWSYREKGMYKQAIAEFLQLPDGPPKLGHMGNAYGRAGNKTEAQKALQRLIEMSKQRVGNYAVALVYAGLGEKDRAFEWLEKAYKVRDKGLCYMKVDPALDPLRSDPRFQDLLRRMNFPK
jgi:TolB-like protein/DNA-binding winged helix-turn-helix (wHTH) protein